MEICKLLNHLLKIILFFYNVSSLPRNVVDNIIQQLRNFIIQIFLPQLKNDILEERDNLSE